MSYDIELRLNDEIVQVPRFIEGGVVQCLPNSKLVIGTTDADINITYNYSKFFYAELDAEMGIRWLYGKTGAETAGRLEKAVKALGTEKDDDYWKATSGNAGHILNVLLGWAILHPDAVWSGD